MGNKKDQQNEPLAAQNGAVGYVAVVSETIQTSEDTWAVRSRTKICNGETTIAEIAEWAGSVMTPSIKSGEIKRDEVMKNVELTQAT